MGVRPNDAHSAKHCDFVDTLPLAIRVTEQFGSAPLAHSFCNSYILAGSSRTTMCCGRSVNEVRASVFKGILHMFVHTRAFVP